MAGKGLADGTVGRPAKGATRKATAVTHTARKTAEEAIPAGQLQQSLQNLAGTLAVRALSGVSDKVAGTAERLNRYAEGGGGSLLSAVRGAEKAAGGTAPVKVAMSAGMDKLKHSVEGTFHTAEGKVHDVWESLSGAKSKATGGKKIHLTNIVEQIDVGVPIRLAYDEWTQFADFPKFMKKVQQVEQVSDEKLEWTGKVFWSKRTWESTIIEQVPFERIVWRSKGHKGYIDGAVTFHELAQDLTRIIMVLEYHPGGLFEKTADLWHAVGRRARLELKHFQRHVMTDSILHPDEVTGWHGEIRDKAVVEDDETARREAHDDEEPESARRRPTAGRRTSSTTKTSDKRGARA